METISYREEGKYLVTNGKDIVTFIFTGDTGSCTVTGHLGAPYMHSAIIEPANEGLYVIYQHSNYRVLNAEPTILVKKPFTNIEDIAKELFTANKIPIRGKLSKKELLKRLRGATPENKVTLYGKLTEEVETFYYPDKVLILDYDNVCITFNTGSTNGSQLEELIQALIDTGCDTDDACNVLAYKAEYTTNPFDMKTGKALTDVYIDTYTTTLYC